MPGQINAAMKKYTTSDKDNIIKAGGFPDAKTQASTTPKQ